MPVSMSYESENTDYVLLEDEGGKAQIYSNLRKLADLLC